MQFYKYKKKSKDLTRKRRINPCRSLKIKLWELCKQITRKKYGNTCYTCFKPNLTGSSWQTGHFLPSSIGGTSLRYDLRNLRPQCYRCNIDLSGNGAIFYKLLVEKEGQEYVDTIFREKEKYTKADEIFYQTKIEEYEKIYESM